MTNSWLFNSFPHKPDFNDPEQEAFENIEGKGENAGNQHFLLFPQCFLPIPKMIGWLYWGLTPL